jgi:hypothetical protein
MTSKRITLYVVIAIFLLLLLGGAGAWYYLYGGNALAAADLVPGDTVFLATIPNGAEIATGYETSRLKSLVDLPNLKPLRDSIPQQVGDKNFDLINTFLPNLSGESFIAITHLDVDHPEQTGFVAAMKPKPGLNTFNAFIDKLKASYSDTLSQGKTGTGNVAGVDYQYVQGPGAPDKICVAQVGGWIVTTWGEASLQDWVERYRNKPATPSLAQSPDYQKSLARIGPDSLAQVYVNFHTLAGLLAKTQALVQSQSGAQNQAGNDYLVKELGAFGGAAMGSNFVNGEIVDRFSFLVSQEGLSDMGVALAPCAYDTLKFTGPDTLFYMGYSVDFKKAWQNLQDQGKPGSSGQPINPMAPQVIQAIQTWTQGVGIDFEHNVINALGQEASLQLDWSDNTSYPDVGFFIKLDKPDDFKPAITALVGFARKALDGQAVVSEVNQDGHNYASLKFASLPVPISPTITEDGPYFGVFLTEDQATRCFAQQESQDLAHNADFARQIGDKRDGSSQLIFIDSPRLLDRAYRTALPSMSTLLQAGQSLVPGLNLGQNFPPDLKWLAPIGTWSAVFSLDADGLQGYSVSGIGNQGFLYYSAILAGAVGAAEYSGVLPNIANGLNLPPVGQPSNGGIVAPGTSSNSNAQISTPATNQPH